MRAAVLCKIFSSLPPSLYLPPCEPNMRQDHVGVAHAEAEGGLGCRQALRPKCNGMRKIDEKTGGRVIYRITTGTAALGRARFELVVKTDSVTQ
eukprot:4896447-Pleurochrysis_carterae.AAC.2